MNEFLLISRIKCFEKNNQYKFNVHFLKKKKEWEMKDHLIRGYDEKSTQRISTKYPLGENYGYSARSTFMIIFQLFSNISQLYFCSFIYYFIANIYACVNVLSIIFYSGAQKYWAKSSLGTFIHAMHNIFNFLPIDESSKGTTVTLVSIMCIHLLIYILTIVCFFLYRFYSRIPVFLNYILTFSHWYNSSRSN